VRGYGSGPVVIRRYIISGGRVEQSCMREDGEDVTSCRRKEFKGGKVASGVDSLLRLEMSWLVYLETVNKVGPLARGQRE
jgi:hypothetical protein